MANTCNNYARFNHPDPVQLKRLIDAGVTGNLFREFVPMGADNSWQACRALWGVKWEADVSKMEITFKVPCVITVEFETANSAPCEFYHSMAQMGWKITAWYWVNYGEGCGRIVAHCGQDLEVDYCNDPLINITCAADVNRALLLDQDLEPYDDVTY